MTQPRLSSPETIRSGGFAGGVSVAPEQAPQGSSLSQLAQALGRFNPALDRALVTREGNRVDQLREDGQSESQQIIASRFQGYTADQIGEALEGNELAERFRKNPYILPALQVHRGRVAADETALNLMQSGVNPADPEAVNSYLQDNAPQVDDPFFSRGFSEQMERQRSQFVQRQTNAAIQQAEDQRIDMGNREFLTTYEDTGDWSAALAALRETPGIEPRDATRIQMAMAARLAQEGRTDELEALVTTRRGDAPSMADDARLAREVATYRYLAQGRAEAAERERLLGLHDSLRDDIFNGDLPLSAIEQDERFAELDAGLQSRVRGYRISELSKAEAEAERLAREAEAERQAAEAEAEVNARNAAITALDDRLHAGASFEDLVASEEFALLDSGQQTVYRRRIRNHQGQSGPTRGEALRAWQDAARGAYAQSLLQFSSDGTLASLDDTTVTDPETGYSVTISSQEARELAQPLLREQLLGPDPWNLSGEQAVNYQEYAQRLRINGMRDPQLEGVFSRAEAYLSPEMVQRGGSQRVAQAFEIYRRLDGPSRSEYVSSTRSRAIFNNVERVMNEQPGIEFAEAYETAIAQFEVSQEMGVSFDNDFRRFEGLLDYRIADPTGGRIQPDRYRTASGDRREMVDYDLRSFASERMLENIAAGYHGAESAEMVQQDIEKEFIGWNGQPVRLPPNRNGGEVTSPIQWSQALTNFAAAEALEHGFDAEDATITHLDNGVYALRRPDGTYRIAHASLMVEEARDYWEFVTERDGLEAAREAGATDTRQ